ncbi:restriction endonuclease subunit S [Plebeiibacterium sediminum]|uniref:Restriction endonuclease subunit S n=1 Tax=Plebeiibacterium sediminum TaxID=2992112 RepID=A0AAE3M9D8_9BACT|nr:restriction endonuclease subunit S [Plebeiobacterium sediminum]MCW3789249.1 restriction endonuclease subunit S [Plebeiobacterium sediminum]
MRFPEFEDEWEAKKIEEIATVSSGGTPSRTKPNYWNGNIPWITTSLIDFNRIKTAEEFITEDGLSNSSAKLFPKSTILMAMYGQGKTRGKVGILDVEASTNQACAALKIKNKFHVDFVFNYLAKDYEKIRNLANDGGQQNLSAGLIKSLKIKTPSLSEQIKLANFLVVIDKRIQTQNKIIEHQESLMKGMMQQIFSQQLRLKNNSGENYPDWEDKKLKDLCEKGTSNISANSLESNSGEYKIYGATGFLQNVNFYQEEEAYISIVKDGAGAGRTLICEAKSSVLGTLDKIKPKNNNNMYFLYLLLKTISFEKYITGSTIPHIYFRDYGNEKIKQPCIEEQTKIACFLSNLDEKLEKEKQILAQYKQQKKHLLQNLFV